MDERNNCPSASGYEALILCRGKHAMERTVPRVDDSSEASRSGDRIHLAMAGEFVTLTDDEQRIAEKFQREEAELVAELVGVPEVQFREKRLWFKDKFSGKPDFVCASETAILIEDYKSGWLGATAAPRNPQLRALVVLVAAHINPLGRPIYVAALLRSGKPSVAKYEASDIEAARWELENILASAEITTAPRTPGEKQCRYCRAISVCPEATKATESLATMHTRELEISDLLRLLDIIGPAKKVIAEIEADAKRRLAVDPASVPGWELSEGTNREKITDVAGVFGRVIEYGVTAAEFTGACGMTKKDLTALLKLKTSKKGKDLDALTKEVTAGLVESKTSAPSLQRIA